MDTLRLTLIQSDLVWESVDANLKNCAEKLDNLQQPTDVVILPEMFSTGFSMNSKHLAEKMSGKSVAWMLSQAKKLDALVLGSLIIEDNGQYYNRLIATFPDGTLKYYDKHHVFTLSTENEHYTAGQSRLQFNYKGFEICPLICYDLRFPVWARNTTNYDFLIYVASWPKPRIDAWDALLKARAIENMSYVVGVNRVGVDGNQYEYPGHSAVYNGLGHQLTEISENESVIHTTINKNHLSEIRNNLKFLEDRDDFKLN